MLGWALVINNLGRRRYPLHWWAAGNTFVLDPNEDENEEATPRQLEDGEAKRESREEGSLGRERQGSEAEVIKAEEPERRGSRSRGRSAPDDDVDFQPASLQSALGATPEDHLRR